MSNMPLIPFMFRDAGKYVVVLCTAGYTSWTQRTHRSVERQEMLEPVPGAYEGFMYVTSSEAVALEKMKELWAQVATGLVEEKGVHGPCRTRCFNLACEGCNPKKLQEACATDSNVCTTVGPRINTYMVLRRHPDRAGLPPEPTIEVLRGLTRAEAEHTANFWNKRFREFGELKTVHYVTDDYDDDKQRPWNPPLPCEKNDCQLCGKCV